MNDGVHEGIVPRFSSPGGGATESEPLSARVLFLRDRATAAEERVAELLIALADAEGRKRKLVAILAEREFRSNDSLVRWAVEFAGMTGDEARAAIAAWRERQKDEAEVRR